MKAKINITLVFSLALIFIFFSTCKRTGIEEPSPLGPSSISIMLTVHVSPNVIQAANTRQASSITAAFKKFDGTPLGNRTVYFSLYDGYGFKINNIGYFEGNVPTKSKVTDASGIARVTYYGPLAQELSGSARIWIGAQASWEGRQFVSELTPLDIVADIIEPIEKLLNISADPAVLAADNTTRESSKIRASLKTIDGIPVPNHSLRFDIVDSLGDISYIGYFKDKKQFRIKATDNQGNIELTYWGPLAAEIDGDEIVYIRATSVVDETITAMTPIHIYEELPDVILNVFANPATLFAGETRGTSAITGTLQTPDGSPIANKILTFDIVDATGNPIYIGYYEGNQSTVSKTTDANGSAQLTYFGPLADEITENTTVYIRATVKWTGEDEFSVMTPIYITLEYTEAILTVFANPATMIAGDTRETSAITGTLLATDGSPVANKMMTFDIVDANGNALYIGYYEGRKSVVSESTDSRGKVQLTYFGPLADEIEDDTVVYIQATVNWSADESISAMAPIYISLKAIDAILNVEADPTSLPARSPRENSKIKAVLETTGGTPIANQTIVLDIVDANGNILYIGYFDDNKNVISGITNVNGAVNATYYGPLPSEITEDTTVYIRATVNWSADESSTAMVPIFIYIEAPNVLLNISADDTALDAGIIPESSNITATLETIYGIPMANEVMTFDIVDANDDKIYIGYFDGNKTEVTQVTDANGQATVLYWGPLAQDLPELNAGDTTTIYIRVRVTIQSQEISAKTPIVITKVI